LETQLSAVRRERNALLAAFREQERQTVATVGGSPAVPVDPPPRGRGRDAAATADAGPGPAAESKKAALPHGRAVGGALVAGGESAADADGGDLKAALESLDALTVEILEEEGGEEEEY
jgi:hypothetical protein